jgi:hypothetical protein
VPILRFGFADPINEEARNDFVPGFFVGGARTPSALRDVENERRRFRGLW